MKRTIHNALWTAACCGAGLLGTLTAYAQNTGFYLRGDLGGNITPDVKLNSFFGPVAKGTEVKMDPGLRAGLAGGYQFCQWFSAEAQVGFYGNRIDSITGATEVHDARFANVPFLANVKLQYPNSSRFTPYIGGGAGFSESILDVGRITIPEGGGYVTMHGNSSDTVFAYQAFAGLRYALNERMGLSLEYHYFGADSPKWSSDFSQGTSSDSMGFGHVQSHGISLAFDFEF